MLGAAAGGDTGARGTAAAAVSSALAYMAGMALNDYADRQVDAVDRPDRPIPSGRITPERALAVGAGLLAADLVVAGWGSGRRGVAYSLATTGSVLAYDFAAKDTAAGPWVMAACRFIDVQRGSRTFRAAALPAALVAAHTYMITRVSRHEVDGGNREVALTSAVTTAAITVTALTTATPRPAAPRPATARPVTPRPATPRPVTPTPVTPRPVTPRPATPTPATPTPATAKQAFPASSAPKAAVDPASWAVATTAAALYTLPSIRASLAAAGDPSASRLQQVVKTGVLGMLPLQGTLTATNGQPGTGAGLLVLWYAARNLATRRRVT
nr:UbiA family prenyltransferase [Kineosporia mesophila]